MTPSAEVIEQLAGGGVLRVGVNMANFLLVTGEDEDGEPTGVSPDLGHAIAERLGVPADMIPFANPGEMADAARENLWDIANMGAEPQRATDIAFTAAYSEIEASYLVPPGSPLGALEAVDEAGVRIATMGRAAYGLWLDRNISRAELVRAPTMDAAFEIFAAGRADVLAGLRGRLAADQARLPGARILAGRFMAVQQAVGCHRAHTAAAEWLAAFIEEAKASGLIAELIARHSVEGLTVAPPAG